MLYIFSVPPFPKNKIRFLLEVFNTLISFQIQKSGHILPEFLSQKSSESGEKQLPGRSIGNIHQRNRTGRLMIPTQQQKQPHQLSYQNTLNTNDAYFYTYRYKCSVCMQTIDKYKLNRSNMNVVCMKSTARTDLDISCDIRHNGSRFPS